MNFDVLLVILFTSIIQSIFGTGVLLFGTPTLLLLNYNFENALIILLPTSILINLLQIKNDYKYIDRTFYKNLILYCLPLVFLTLYLSKLDVIDVNISIGMFLMIISMQYTIKKVKEILKYFLQFEKLYLMIMGTLHGLTNLGGSLLTGAILSKNLSKKSKRSTIAISYLSMAIIQIITLTVMINIIRFIDSSHIMYWILGLFVFFIIEKYFYHAINERIYIRYSSFFLFSMGLLLIFKN